MQHTIRRRLASGLFLLAFSGCSFMHGTPATSSPAPSNVPSAAALPAPQNATSSATSPPADSMLSAGDAMFRQQYISMCQQRIGTMQNMPGADATAMSHMCDCVADKMIQGRKLAAEKGNQAAAADISKMMMDCVPGGNPAERLARHQQEMEENIRQMEEGDAPMPVVTVSPKSAHNTDTDAGGSNTNSSQDEQQPANRHIKYDPKTGTWSN